MSRSRSLGLFVTMAAFLAAGPVLAAGAKRPTPPHPLADPGKTALHCGSIYLETAPDLFEWRGEIRGHCDYSNFCYTHGDLSIEARVAPEKPDEVRVSYAGSARRIMDFCGRLYCEKRKVGKAWYRGELVIPLSDVTKASFATYHYKTRDIFYPGHSEEHRTADPVRCEWKTPWTVIDLHPRSGD